MAPRNTVTWRRPYTSIYNNNYKYGTNLYSDTLSSCQKKNRPGSSLSFTSSTVSQTPTPAAIERDTLVSLPPSSPAADILPSSSYQGSIFQNLMNTAFYSPYAKDVDTELDLQTTKKKTTTTTSTVTATSSLDRQPASKPATTPTETPRPQSLCLYDDANLFLTNPKVIPPASVRLTDDGDTKKKRKKVVSETTTTTKISSSSAPATSISTTTTTLNSPPQNGPSVATHWKEQCHDLQSQVDILTQALADVNAKLKGELSTIKGKLHSEIADMNVSVEQSSLQSNELQRTVKRQTNQLLELQSAYDDLQRHLQDSLDEVAGYQKRSVTLRKEMDRLRTEVVGTLSKSQNAARA